MGFRVPAPDGRRGKDGLPLLVLPEETILKESYTMSYLTVGGMSIVYRGNWQGTTYFVKEVDSLDPRKIVSLSQEKATLERLSHPGIIKVYDFFEQEGFYYLVLEFVEGTSLDKLIAPMANVFLQERIVLDWALQLYGIFEYLHSQNPPIIYRDLKPQNIMKDAQGRIRLVDFGIARVYKDSRGEDTEMMGSAITASPEHYGAKQTDARSDIFTLGATLNYLLTNGKGRGEDHFQFLPIRAINPRASENMERLIMKALEMDPDKRFKSMQEMRRAQLSMCSGAAAKTEELKTVELSGKPRRHPEKGLKSLREALRALLPTAGIIALASLLMIAGVMIVQKAMLPQKTAGSAATLPAPSSSPSAVLSPIADNGSPLSSPSAAVIAVPTATTTAITTTPTIILASPVESAVPPVKKSPAIMPSLIATPAPRVSEPPIRRTEEPTAAPVSSPGAVQGDPISYSAKKAEIIASLMRASADEFNAPPGARTSNGVIAYTEQEDRYVVPPGYLQMRGTKQYVNVEPGNENGTFRRIEVAYFKLIREEDFEKEMRFHDQYLSTTGAYDDNSAQFIHFGFTAWKFEFKRHEPEVQMKLKIREIFIKNRRSTCYIMLSASASPDSFGNYEKEFTAFIDSFLFKN
jgi:serine/threonine protein kinase